MTDGVWRVFKASSCLLSFPTLYGVLTLTALVGCGGGPTLLKPEPKIASDRKPGNDPSET